MLDARRMRRRAELRERAQATAAAVFGRLDEAFPAEPSEAAPADDGKWWG